MLRRRMRLKCLARLPDFDDRVVVRARILLQYLEAHNAWVLFAFCRKFVQRFGCISGVVGRDVDVCHHIYALAASCGLLGCEVRDHR